MIKKTDTKKACPRWAKFEAAFACRLALSGEYHNSFAEILDGKRHEGHGYFEVMDGFGAFTIRRVYSAWDEPFLCEALAKAEERYPSQDSYHECNECWKASPCLAVRAFVGDDHEVQTIPIYVATGCGNLAEVIESLTEKLDFVRSAGLDAFLAWVDRVPPWFLLKEAAKSN